MGVVRRLVLDCDNALGLLARDVDDGLALMALCGRPDIDLVGVTACFGNAPMRRCLQQTRKLLALLGRPDTPLLPGAAAAGQGNTDAACFLVQAARREPGTLTVLAMGPLTNVAAALALDPGFLGNLRELACLGGNLFAGRLGWRGVNELNFGCDPAAAWAVLAARGCPVLVVPATSCLGARFTPVHLARLRRSSKPARQVADAVARWLACMRLGRGINHFVPWDVVAALALVEPELVRAATGRVSLEPAPGMRLRLDPGDASGSPHRLVSGVADADRLMEALFAALDSL